MKKSGDSEGDLIGDGSLEVHGPYRGWPTLSYKFKEEYWNKGYATEFTKTFMEFLWSLPRMGGGFRTRVPPSSVDLQHIDTENLETPRLLIIIHLR